MQSPVGLTSPWRGQAPVTTGLQLQTKTLMCSPPLTFEPEVTGRFPSDNIKGFGQPVDIAVLLVGPILLPAVFFLSSTATSQQGLCLQGHLCGATHRSVYFLRREGAGQQPQGLTLAYLLPAIHEGMGHS